MTTAPMLPRSLTVPEAAARARVSPRTIYRWIESGRLRARRTVSGMVRIEEAALWLPEDPDGTPPTSRHTS